MSTVPPEHAATHPTWGKIQLDDEVCRRLDGSQRTGQVAQTISTAGIATFSVRAEALEPTGRPAKNQGAALANAPHQMAVAIVITAIAALTARPSQTSRRRIRTGQET